MPSLLTLALLSFVILAMLFGVLVYALCHDTVPAGAIPTEPPDEARRVHHPAGYSIVIPPKWELVKWGRHGDDSQWMYHLPPSSGIRSVVLFTITGFGRDRPRDLEGFQKIRFQGRQAYEKMECNRNWTFDDPPSARYELYFERRGQWFGVDYLVQDERTELPASVRQYLNTLRWDEEPAR